MMKSIFLIGCTLSVVASYHLVSNENSLDEEKYICADGKCMLSTSGFTKSECEASCILHAKYECVTTDDGEKKCEATMDGPFGNLSDCSATCHVALYRCKEGSCVESPTGVDADTCSTICQEDGNSKYKCQDGKCIMDKKKGVTRSVCEEICTPETTTHPKTTPHAGAKYKCVDQKCIESVEGVSYATCSQICGSNNLPSFMTV